MNYCSCPNCRTDNCPAGVELAAAQKMLVDIRNDLKLHADEDGAVGIGNGMWIRLNAAIDKAKDKP